MPPSLAVATQTPDLAPRAQALAEQLQLPFTSDIQHYNYILLLTPDYLGIIQPGEKTLPLYVNFISGKLAYRRQNATARNEILARAMGVKSQSHPKIIDATAGLGRDSFILASLGFEVYLIERSPIIHALLDDGIKRALENPDAKPIVERLHLIQSDAITWLNQQTDQPDIIYLDPMFPERQKSALVKKEMRIFHELVGEDPDAERLLKTALTCVAKRVVVKRPRLAKPIAGPTPSFCLKGTSSRFDIYLT